MAHTALQTALFKYYANNIFLSAKTHTEDSFSEVSGHPPPLGSNPSAPQQWPEAPAFLNSTRGSPEITVYAAKAYSLQAS